jgi:hypothetical protein
MGRWEKLPWGDPERPGIRLLWVSVLISGLAVVYLVVAEVLS